MTDYCCDAFQEIVKDYDLPLEQPVCFKKDTMELESDKWAMRLLWKTQSGKVSQRHGPVVYLNYCPFCGTVLREQAASEKEETRSHWTDWLHAIVTILIILGGNITVLLSIGRICTSDYTPWTRGLLSGLVFGIWLLIVGWYAGVGSRVILSWRNRK